MLDLFGSRGLISSPRFFRNNLGDLAQVWRHTRKRGANLLRRACGEQVRQLLVTQRRAVAGLVFLSRLRIDSLRFLGQVGDERIGCSSSGNLHELPAADRVRAEALDL